MKLREPAGRKGGRTPLLRAAEAIGRPEVVEPAKFKWIEVTQETETLRKLCAALKEGLQEEPERDREGEELRKFRVRMAFYLTTLCQGHPELLDIQPEELKEIALQRMDDTDFTSDEDDYLAGVLSQEARREIHNSQKDVDQSLADAQTNYAKVHILFGLAIGAPDVALKKRGLLTRLLPQEITSLREKEGQSAVTEAAWLVLLDPEKRGEVMNALTARSVEDHQRRLRLRISRLQAQLDLIEAEAIAHMLFRQQVLAAQDGKILSSGEIELTSPTQVVQTRTPLPERSLT